MPKDNSKSQTLNIEELLGHPPPQQFRPTQSTPDVKQSAEHHKISEAEKATNELLENQPQTINYRKPVASQPETSSEFKANATKTSKSQELINQVLLADQEQEKEAKLFQPLLVNLSPTYDPFADVINLNVGSIVAIGEASWISRLLQLSHLKQILTRRRLKYIGIAIVSFSVFALIFNYQIAAQQLSYLFNPPKPAPSVNLPTAEPAGVAPQAEVVSPDNVIIIPKINVNAPVVYEPSQQENNIQLALRNGVVHYAGTAIPGENGNVAIVGHSSNDWWEPGNYKFVFVLLDKLVVGDKIQINYSSHKYVYQVASTRVVAPTDLTVLDQTPTPTLTLITCTPPGTSWKRLIVSANQIEPLPSAEQKPVLAVASSQPVKTLPGSAPSINDQISHFFNNIFSFLAPKQKSGQNPNQPNSKPAQTQPHLPEISNI